MALAQRKIPVSCIGLGEDKEFNDLSVEFTTAGTAMRKGEKKELSLRVSSSFDREVTTNLSIYNESELLETSFGRRRGGL